MGSEQERVLARMRSRAERAEAYAGHLKDATSVMLAERYASDVPWLMAALTAAQQEVKRLEGVMSEVAGDLESGIEDRRGAYIRLLAAVQFPPARAALAAAPAATGFRICVTPDCPELPRFCSLTCAQETEGAPAAGVGEERTCTGWDPYATVDHVCKDCGETWRAIHRCPAGPPSRAPAPPSASAGQNPDAATVPVPGREGERDS